MIHFKTYLDDWSIEVYIIIDKANIRKITKSIQKLGASTDILDKVYQNLHNNVNTGFTYTNPSRHKSIMIINKSSSIKEFINTYNHEKNHVEMHICEELDIDPYSEEAAYLSGELSAQLFIPVMCSFFK